LLVQLIPYFAWAQLNPFEALQYDSAVAYEFQGMGDRRIVHCLKNEPSKISKQTQLTTYQLNVLEKLLTITSSYGNTTAACFDPHFAVVYFLGDQIVGSIDICLGCNYLESTPEIPATTFKMIKLSDDYSYPAKGFTPEARLAIYELCKSLGFTRYLSPPGESIFDQ
jgi:hypothetical protein